MSPKGKNSKKHRKDESSDIHSEDKQFKKKKHSKDESSDIHSEDKRFKKKKYPKDESSDIKVEDKPLEKLDVEDYHQHGEFVYYDPSIIETADIFQEPAQYSHDTHQNEDFEAKNEDGMNK